MSGVPGDPRNPGFIIGEQTDQLGGVVNQDGLLEDSQGNIVDDIVIQPVETTAPSPVYNTKRKRISTLTETVDGTRASSRVRSIWERARVTSFRRRTVTTTHLNDIDNDLKANRDFSDWTLKTPLKIPYTPLTIGYKHTDSETRNRMIFTDSSLDNISNENLQRPFADKENYEKYIQLKRDPRGVFGCILKSCSLR